ncbi:glycerate kinase [Paenibacillus soyae]|uniref:Glycerate kinase n=1 Tax=Paenibacillus soyae TaxID=2969249 RepID=A0A9X2MWX7_9BACL|nr:glycerate kinase [Paenibacillus soyae]
MKVVLAFDSFKGSLTSSEAGAAAALGVRAVFPDAECKIIVLADGGEGTVEAAVGAAGGVYLPLQVAGPLGEPVEARAGIIIDEATGERTAVLETANICGLTLIPPPLLNPERTSSRGLGEAIRMLLDSGLRRLVVGLGGSGTNDGGLGMLAALGAELHDERGQTLYGTGGDLLRLGGMELSGLDERLWECRIIVASDVTNPLCGPNGASLTYGKQKGASFEQRTKLDEALERYSRMLEAKLGGGSWRDAAGAGAAGGLGFAFLALGGQMVSGAEWLMRLAAFQEKLREADWVLTGEGRSDASTANGKLPWRVLEAARRAGTKCVLLSGSFGEGSEELEAGYAGCFSIMSGPADVQFGMEHAAMLLEQSSRRVFRLISGIGQG